MGQATFDTLPFASFDKLVGGGGLVVVSPHPDDETLGCGGLIAEARSRNRQVKIVIVTDGTGSHRRSVKYPPQRLRDLRQKESAAALGHLDVPRQDIVFLDVGDGAVPTTGPEAEGLALEILGLARLIDASALAVTWRHDSHPDHVACCAIARLVKAWQPALRLLEYPIWGYEDSVKSPTDPDPAGYRIDCERHVPRKKQAIQEYQSQISRLIDDAPYHKPLPGEMIERFQRPYEVFLELPDATPSRQVVRHVHQILLVDGFGTPRRLPRFVRESAALLRTLYPGADYRLWDGNALRGFIEDNFPGEVLAAFDLLRPYAYKADLGRYCLLYQFGGLYADLSMRAVAALSPPPEIGLVAFRDYDFLSPSWSAAAVGLIWAAPKRREFEIAIDYLVRNCRDKYYGKSPLYPTGPVLFGRALAAAMTEKRQLDSADDQWIGTSRPVTPDAGTKNICYVAPDNSLIAILGKSRGGDLTHLGATGTNNYNEHWHKKTVYGESVHVWLFDDPAIRLTENAERTRSGIAARPGAVGFLTFGPYVDIEAGDYRLSIVFGGVIQCPRMIVDVPYDAGKSILLAVERPAGEAADRSRIDIDFTAPQALHAVEFRTQAFGPLPGEIVEIRLEQLQPGAPDRTA